MPRSASRRRRAIVRACAFVDQLEPRRLLASVGVSSGVLTVNADGTNDVISITSFNGNVRVTLNGSVSDHNPATFTAMLVNADGGNDNVTIASTITKPSTLKGGAGNDSLVGGGGSDTIDGGAGGDTMKGGGGVDTVDYSTRTNAVTVGLGTIADDGEAGEKDNAYNDIENILGGAGSDWLKGTAAGNALVGNGGNDTISGNFGNDTLVGGAGNDVLYGDGGNDTSIGGTGDDYMDSYVGDDSLDGGDGNDTLNAHFGKDTVRGGAGHDLVYGGPADTTNGTDGNDSLAGDAGDDSISGGLGNDTLSGGDGIDTLDGQGGTDTAENSAGDTLISIENGGGGGAVITADRTLLVTGTGGADNIRVGFGMVGSDYANTVVINGQVLTFRQFDFDRLRIDALGGNDVVDIDVPRFGAEGTFEGAVVNLGDGNDHFEITEAGATVNGGNGNDSVFGSDGGALFNGDGGIDLYQQTGFDSPLHVTLAPTTENGRLVGYGGSLTGNALDNHLGGGDGAVIRGLGGNDTLLGGADHDDTVTLEGGDGNDTLRAALGTTGDVTFLGGAGNDSMIGGGGNDRFDGGAGGDTIKGGGGNDTADYSSRTGNLSIGLGTLSDDGELGEGDNVAIDVETILGGSGNDVISAANAGTAANLLVGNGGNDSLFGGGGNDTLSGDAGSDTLDGGDGIDTAVNATGDALVDVENSGGGGAENTAVVEPDGTLVITGSSGGDEIGAGFLDGDDAYDVFIGTTGYDFELTEFSRVEVNLLDGDDLVRFDWGLLGLSADVETLVNAGDGADQIELTTSRASVVGGAGADYVTLIKGGSVTGFDGGAGVDQIEHASPVDATLDLRLYPSVERGGVFQGTVIGNDLGNTLFITGGGGTLLGGGGNDSLVGSNANDSLDGQAGDDSLDGSLGSDTMKGGDGNDTVDYSWRTSAIRVGIGTLSDDGEAGENDNVYLDIETVLGGSGNDTIIGGAANNLLVGNAGNDSIRGNYGNDTLVGGAGTDTLNGEAGTDTAQDAAGDVLVSIENG